MTASNHELGFRPSRFPALAQCIHYQQKEGESEARDRGSGTHARIAFILNIAKATGELAAARTDDPPEVHYAVSIVNDHIVKHWSIFAIEQPIDIIDDAGEKITEGTIDLVLERNREYLIIDWKTGDKSDYSAQLNAYEVAWWDLHPEATDVRTLIAYVDLRETESVSAFISYAAQQVQLLWERWRTRDLDGTYTINDYCPYCALRGDCPAWRASAANVLGVPDFVTVDVDLLKNSPDRLESFMLAWDRCKTLVEDEWQLREALKTHMQTGHKSDHFILVVVKDKKEVLESVDPEGFLLKVAREIGTSNAAPAITVDPHKALAAWKAFTDKPFPLAFTQEIANKPGYSYVRLKGKLGRGDAAKKRKELEP
jgi:hypothetical protein